MPKFVCAKQIICYVKSERIFILVSQKQFLAKCSPLLNKKFKYNKIKNLLIKIEFLLTKNPMNTNRIHRPIARHLLLLVNPNPWYPKQILGNQYVPVTILTLTCEITAFDRFIWTWLCNCVCLWVQWHLALDVLFLSHWIAHVNLLSICFCLPHK